MIKVGAADDDRPTGHLLHHLVLVAIVQPQLGRRDRAEV
jgi:hypothetical protein